jgi:WD40 repeat protein
MTIAMRGNLGVCAALLAMAAPLFGQAPTAESVQVLATKYAEEKAKSQADGAEKASLPGLSQRAEELARKATLAASGGRLLEASELYRQARWQLPYLPTRLPPHVAHVFGNFRLRHSMDVTAAAFSPDGRYLATGSSDRSVKLWDLANGHEARVYSGHVNHVEVVAISPDGKTIASAGWEGEVHLWEAATGKLIKKLSAPGDYTNSLAFSRDGKTLVAGYAGKKMGARGYITLTDVASAEHKRIIPDARSLVRVVTFNHKGDILAAGCGDGSVRFYSYPKVVQNANEPEYWEKQDITGSTDDIVFSADDKSLIRCGADGIKIYAVAQPGESFAISAPKRVIANTAAEERFKRAVTSPDSKTLIAGTSEGVLRIIDFDTGQIVSSLRGHAGDIRSLALHPQGTQIASAGSECTVRLWDFDVVLQARDYLGHDGAVWSAAFSPDGKKIVSASADQTVRVWEVGSTARAAHTLKGHVGPVTMAMFTPDGKNVVSCGADKTVKVWDAEQGTAVRELTGHTGTVTAFDISQDGKRLVSGGADRHVKVWDLPGGKELATVSGAASVVAAIAIHPSGDKFAVGNVDQTIGLYDISGKLLHRWAAHGIAVSGLSFSPNGKWLASCGADGIVRVWTVAAPTSGPVALTGHNGPLSSVAFRKDSQHLVSSGADLSVKLWKLDADDGKELQTYRGHRDWVSTASFSKDGYYVVSASVDRSIKVWEITSKDLPLLPEHTGAVEAVAFSPDGSKIASGSSDRSIKIWDRATGQELTTIRGHTNNVISLLFSGDGKTLISGSKDLSIRFWDVSTGKELPRSTTQQQGFTRLESPPRLLSLSSDGKTLVAWLHNTEEQRFTTMAGFDLEGNDKFEAIRDRGRSVVALSFSGNGRRAATGAANGSVRIWELEKQATIPGGDWFFFDDKVGVADLALTPDGQSIIVASDRGDIRIADIAKKSIKKTFKAHPGQIAACSVSPNGKRFVTLDSENTVKLWDLATGDELRQWGLGPLMENRSSSVVNLAISNDGKYVALGNANTTLLLLEGP